MEELHPGGPHTIDPRKNSAWREHPKSFAKYAVLQGRRRYMVEHRKREHARKQTIAKRHLCSISHLYGDLAVSETLTESGSCVGIEFQAGSMAAMTD